MKPLKPRGTVTIPPAPRKGMDILDWCKKAQIAITQLAGRNFVAPANSPGSGGVKDPFWVNLFYDSTAATWKYRVTPGYVTYQLMGKDTGSGPVHYYTPTMGGSSLEADPPPEGTLPANQSYIYLRVQTNDKGVISATPTITAETSEQTSTHHIVPNPSGQAGTSGDYYFLLAETQSDGGTPAAPEMVRRITGNRFIPNQLVELRNIGGEREIYSGYMGGANDRHELRTLESVGTGKPTLKPEPAAGEGDTLQFRSLDVQSPLNGVLSFEAVDTADVIELKSTGVNTTATVSVGDQFEMVGGVVKNYTAAGTTGWWGSISWLYADAGGGFSRMQIDVENGIIVDVSGSNTSPGNGYTESGLGTEGSPGTMDLTFSDTDT